MKAPCGGVEGPGRETEKSQENVSSFANVLARVNSDPEPTAVGIIAFI